MEGLVTVIANEKGEVLSYSANQMSDGERAALYLLAKVLLAPPGLVLVIDEPETHFHNRLAVRLWDSLEQQRNDMRFVYVTHDLTFALSRDRPTFLLADPRSGLVPVDVSSSLPTEIRREILGAASFSYFASRVVFCEGEDGSLDYVFFSAWFRSRDTVVLPVGSRDSVRQCVKSLAEAKMIDNLDSIGIVDRDYFPDVYLAGLGPEVVVLPFHEVEGLLCLPDVVTCLASHLGKTLDDDLADVTRSAVSDVMLFRVAVDRARLRLRTSTEDVVLAKPNDWRREESLKEHFSKVGTGLTALGDARSIFEKEVAELRAILKSGDVKDILRLFPSKPIAGVIAGRLGMNVQGLFQLMGKALRSTDDDDLGKLGVSLEVALQGVGLPPRAVAERTFTAAGT